MLVYKIPYRRARTWLSARASKGILHTIQMHIFDIDYKYFEKDLYARDLFVYKIPYRRAPRLACV